jgi:hypothetical protein
MCSTASTWWGWGDGKASPVTGCGGPQCREMLRLSHFLDNWLTDSSEVVNLTCRLPSTPQEDSWYSFLTLNVFTYPLSFHLKLPQPILNPILPDINVVYKVMAVLKH